MWQIKPRQILTIDVKTMECGISNMASQSKQDASVICNKATHKSQKEYYYGGLDKYEPHKPSCPTLLNQIYNVLVMEIVSEVISKVKMFFLHLH